MLSAFVAQPYCALCTLYLLHLAPCTLHQFISIYKEFAFKKIINSFRVRDDRGVGFKRSLKDATQEQASVIREGNEVDFV